MAVRIGSINGQELIQYGWSREIRLGEQTRKAARLREHFEENSARL